MGGAGIALKKLNIECQIYSIEIDKYANQVSNALLPDTINLGDVTKINVNELPKIDLIIFGSPCQGFSFAGKMLNFEDPRSSLFFVANRILNECRAINPNIKFLMENVEMTKESENVITRFLGIDPLHINSNLVSAQNRKRLYWTNIGTVKNNLFGIEQIGIKQPKDRKIFLKDILEAEVDKKYFLSEKSVNTFNNPSGKNAGFKYKPISEFETSKAVTITARMHKGGRCDNWIVCDKKGNIKANQQKASCFTAGWNSGGNHSDMDLLFITQKSRGFNKGGDHYEKSPTITGQSWQNNNHVAKLNKSNESNNSQPYQHNRVYDINYKSPCMDTDAGRKNVLVKSNVRRLTPLEVARLQTIPPWEIEIMLNCGVSDTQLYKMLGNGFTVEVIIWILSHLKQ
jgi:DNA (cytosine-5)-methyltransferase 3A